MNFGISTACFYPQSLEKTIDVFGENNIKNIEIFFNTFSELKKDYVAEIKKTKEHYGQSVVAVHPFTCGFEPFMFFTDYDLRFKDGIDMYKSYFEVMNWLDCNIFVFHGDRKQGHLSNEIYFERFAKLRDIGKEFGVIVAQENVERCKSGNLIFLEEMLKYLDNDVAFVFDNKQALRSDVSVNEYLNICGKHIIHVHLSDNTNDRDCLPPFEGTLDISDLLSKLKQKGFDKTVMIEVYSESIKNETTFFENFNRLYSSICTT